MAQFYDIKSIILPHDEDELHIKCGTSEIEDGAITDSKLAPGGVATRLDALSSAAGYTAIQMTSGYYIKTGAVGTTLDPTPVANAVWRYALLEVSEGDAFTVNGLGSSSSSTRVWCFTDTEYKILSVWPYHDPGTVTNEVVTAPADGYMVCQTRGSSEYVSYRGEMPNARISALESRAGALESSVSAIGDDLDDVSTPFSAVIRAASYSPLGSLSKGYICLTCDDGTADLVSYTIPMLQSKGVPCTFGLFSTSDVVTNPEYLAQVASAVSDGCCVAVHGRSGTWSDDAAYMYDVISEQVAALTAAGLTPHGAIMPGASGGTAYLTPSMRCVAGGMLGCVAGVSDPSDAIIYDQMENGPRSNMFALNRVSAVSSTYTLAIQKAMIDACVTNHWLMIPFWHDSTIAGSAVYQERLEELIDYAKASGIEFCTFADIPTLI